MLHAGGRGPGRGADHATGEAEGVVGEDGLRRAVVVAGGDLLDELLDVDGRWAAMLGAAAGAKRVGGGLALFEIRGTRFLTQT